MKTSEIPRAELERLHRSQLVPQSLRVREVLTKAIEENAVLLGIMVEIGPTLDAWRALPKIATDMKDAAYDRAQNYFESLEMGLHETVGEYFARMNVVPKQL